MQSCPRENSGFMRRKLARRAIFKDSSLSDADGTRSRIGKYSNSVLQKSSLLLSNILNRLEIRYNPR